MSQFFYSNEETVAPFLPCSASVNVSPLIMIISVPTLYKHIEKEQMSTPYKSHIKVLKYEMHSKKNSFISSFS